MKASMRIVDSLAIFTLTAVLLSPFARAQDAAFHNAPASAKQMANPYEGQAPAAGKPLYHLRCARCHGENGEGSGNIPPLAQDKIKAAASGELFWFITKGDVNNGMPSWASLPARQRWLIVNYVKTLGLPQSAVAQKSSAAPEKTTAKNFPLANAAFHRLSLREARADSQDHASRIFPPPL